jgi:lipoate synthase
MFRKQGTRVQLGLEDIEEFQQVMDELSHQQQVYQQNQYMQQQQQQQQQQSFQPSFGNTSYQSIEQRIGFTQQQQQQQRRNQ